MLEHTLWVEKYRPKTIVDCVLPKETKKLFLEMLNKGELLNLLLSGPSGTGKTTVARALCEELGADYIVINGSMNGNIDTLRNEIQQFASSVSMFSGQRKVVILDEADYLSHVTQPALRNFMEEFSQNAAFILTCNFPNKIIDPLKGRCSTIEFSIPNGERNDLVKETLRQIRDILTAESVPHYMKVVAALTTRYFPNIRKAINELQKYAHTGKIDSGILSNQSSVADITKILKSKKFTDMRKWVAENSDMDFASFVDDLYKNMSEEIDASKIPHLVLILNRYDYQNSMVSNREINIAAMLLEIMSDCV